MTNSLIKSMKFIATSLFVSGLFYTPATAATSDWVDGRGLKKEFKKWVKNEEIPVSISCKEGNGSGKSQKGTLFKITTKSNSEKVWFTYAWGITSDYKRHAGKANLNGYKVVSSDSFTRTSGKTTRCAVFHHPTKRGK